MSDSTIRNLFVYGTLQQNRSREALWLAQKCRWLGEAKHAGCLVDLGSYPGLIAAAQADDWVYGELWELPADPAASQEILDRLDRYEGCHPDDPTPHEYVRVASTAQNSNSSAIRCWTYLYLLGRDGHPMIHTGRWN